METKLTPQEIKEKMADYKLPTYVRFVEMIWFKFARYSIFLIFVILLILGIVYNSIKPGKGTDIIWTIVETTFFTLFGFGLMMLSYHLLKNKVIKKEAQKLGISVATWNQYAIELGLITKY